MVITFLKNDAASKHAGHGRCFTALCISRALCILQLLTKLYIACALLAQDLESKVAGQQSELEVLTQRSQQLVAENECLREGQIRDLDALVKQTGADRGLNFGGTSSGSAAAGGSGPGVGAREMIDELNERVTILMAENALMADQTTALAAELQEVNKEV